MVPKKPKTPSGSGPGGRDGDPLESLAPTMPAEALSEVTGRDIPRPAGGDETAPWDARPAPISVKGAPLTPAATVAAPWSPQPGDRIGGEDGQRFELIER